MLRRIGSWCVTLLVVGSAMAAESPLRAANEFWDAWSRGDVAGAVSMWDPARDPARVERFRAVFQREAELRCLRVLRASLRESGLTPATATVDVDALVVIDVNVERTRIEEEHHVIELRATAGDWKVVGFRSREDVFAEALVHVPAEERAARVAANPTLITPRLAIALGRCAILLSSRQRNDEAQAILVLARSIADETESDAARSAVIAAESVDRRRTALPNDVLAVQLAEEAERVAFRAGDSDAIGRARIRLARAIEGIDGPRAEALLLDVIDSADTLFDTATPAIAASQLAWTYGDRLESARGFRYSLLAQRYAELSGDPSARLNAAMNVAGSYLASGDLELAKLHYERAVAVARESDAIAAQVFSMRALVELAAEADPGAEPAILEQTLALASCAGDPIDATAVPLLVMRARMAIARRDFARAREALSAAYGLLSRTVIDDRFHAETLAAEADLLLAENRPAEALGALEGAEAVVAARPEWEFERVWSRSQARALWVLGRRDEAIAVLRQAVALYERERASLPVDPRARQSFYLRSGTHDQLVAYLVEAGRPEEAIAVADQRTARTLQDFAHSSGSRKGPESRELERAERAVIELNRRIRTARPGDPSLERHRQRRTAARLELDDLRMRSTAEQPSLPPQATPAAIDLHRVGSRSAILRYVVTDRQTFVFVVRNGADGLRVTARRLAISERQLGRRVNALAARIGARDADYRLLARALHDLLIRPVAADLRGVQQLAIVPDRALWEVPFQTLLDARGVDLLERFEVRYAPSVSWLLRDSGSRRRPASILALGDPEITATGRATARSLVPGRTLGPLPDAALEAREAARLYPRSRVLTGSAADESALKDEASHFDVVHVATHALIDEAQPLYSSLVLSTHNADDDGLLEARELLSLDLGAELFVLSACSTAGGRSYGGEGVVGLAWALLANGVPHVVVSQWNADSRATRKLMVSFHRFLVAGDSPAAALRKAQLELRREARYEDPLYWAPFIVLGTATEVPLPPALPVSRRSQASSTGPKRRP
jgi:CHAT domain-containing protein